MGERKMRACLQQATQEVATKATGTPLSQSKLDELVPAELRSHKAFLPARVWRAFKIACEDNDD